MKKRLMVYSAVIAVLVLIVSLSALTKLHATPPKVTDDKGITFIEQDWDKALKQAKAENKLVFLDIYASWCGPCKLLKKNTFSDQKIGDFFNKTFVNVSVDGEKGVGPSLAQQFSLQGYPTLIVADASGKPVLYTMGYIDPATLMEFAQAALKKKP